jgi:hypothetical protein
LTIEYASSCCGSHARTRVGATRGSPASSSSSDWVSRQARCGASCSAPVSSRLLGAQAERVRLLHGRNDLASPLLRALLHRTRKPPCPPCGLHGQPNRRLGNTASAQPQLYRGVRADPVRRRSAGCRRRQCAPSFAGSGRTLRHLLDDPFIPLVRADVIVEWGVAVKRSLRGQARSTMCCGELGTRASSSGGSREARSSRRRRSMPAYLCSSGAPSRSCQHAAGGATAPSSLRASGEACARSRRRARSEGSASRARRQRGNWTRTSGRRCSWRRPLAVQRAHIRSLRFADEPRRPNHRLRRA